MRFLQKKILLFSDIAGVNAYSYPVPDKGPTQNLYLTEIGNYLGVDRPNLHLPQFPLGIEYIHPECVPAYMTKCPSVSDCFDSLFSISDLNENRVS